MEPQHEQVLKDILSKNQSEFARWVGSLSEKEIDYVSWLMDKAIDVLDDLLLEQHGMVEAQQVLERIKNK